LSTGLWYFWHVKQPMFGFYLPRECQIACYSHHFYLYLRYISFIYSHLNDPAGGQIRLLPLADYRAVPY
ncbi:TPA: hypothetical protein ACSP2Y_001972, partial [Aeromonas veronii]